MSVDVGTVRLRFETSSAARARAERVARELRASLGAELARAAGSYALERDVALVADVKVTVRAPLRSIRGADLARAIATESLRTIARESPRLRANGGAAGTAEWALLAYDAENGVRIDAATEAAAWLVALASDRPTFARQRSPYADLAHRPSGAAFLEVCRRFGDAGAVVRALGARWARTLALRCAPGEAERLLAALDDGAEPEASTWLAARGALSGARSSRAVAALAYACDAVVSGTTGAAKAARTLLTAVPRDETLVSENGVWLASFCTGFWLLLPHLAPAFHGREERAARAIAAAVAERLFGCDALEDPALAPVLGGERPDELAAALPADARVARIAVRAIRAFANSLPRFERSRCGYVLAVLLSGQGEVRQTSAGFEATLPRAPLRIVLDRAGALGPVATTWATPRLTLVRDP
jgi:hypothetical protein